MTLAASAVPCLRRRKGWLLLSSVAPEFLSSQGLDASARRICLKRQKVLKITKEKLGQTDKLLKTNAISSLGRASGGSRGLCWPL